MCSLSAGGAFGERSFLNDKPRTASVRCAQSGRVMHLTREQCELALGAPVQQVLTPLLAHSKSSSVSSTWKSGSLASSLREACKQAKASAKTS